MKNVLAEAGPKYRRIRSAQVDRKSLPTNLLSTNK